MATAITAGMTWTQVNNAINGAPSPDTFNWEADTYRADADLARRSGDIHVGAGIGSTIISGADDISSGWVADGGLWKKTGVTQRSSVADHGSTGHFHDLTAWNGGSGRTNAGEKPETLYMDKVHLIRVNQKAAVSDGPISDNVARWGYVFTKGSWYFDEGANTIWIGHDPTGETVELGLRNRVCGTTDNVTFTDMTVEGFIGGQSGQDSPIPRAVNNQTLTRMEFRLIHGYGFGITLNSTYTDCVSHDNGHMGAGGSNADNFTMTRCDFYSNNIQHWKPIWEAGGYKVTVTDDGTVTDCAAWNNHGTAHWFDIRNNRNQNIRCSAYDNAYPGFNNEIGFEHLFEHCVARNTGWGHHRINPSWWDSGFRIQDSSDTTIRECYNEQGTTHPYTGASHTTDGIVALDGGPRGSPTPPSQGWLTTNTTVERCINDSVNTNAGHSGPKRDSSSEFADINTHSWDRILWYGPASAENSTRWMTWTGPYQNFATFTSQSYVTNNEFRTGRAPRTMTVTSSVTLNEANLIAGGAVLTFTIDEIEAGYPDWLTDWFHGNLGDDSSTFRTDLMTDLIAGITGSGAGGTEFNSEVVPLLDYTAFTRTNDHSFTLTLPAAASYSSSGETLSFVIPASNMVSRQSFTAGNTLDIEGGGGAVTNVVALEDGWEYAHDTASQSPTHTHAAPTGTEANRLLVAFVFFESTSHQELTSLTYGGQAMTEQEDVSTGGGAGKRGVKLFSLDETGIDAAEVAADDAFVFTWDVTPDNYVRIYTRFFDNVNQTTPWVGTSTGEGNLTPIAPQWDDSVAVTAGVMGVYGAVRNGGRTPPAASVDESYAEDYDHNNNDNFTGGTKLFDASGSTQPTVTFTGTGPERVAIAGGVLQFSASSGSIAINVPLPTLAFAGTSVFQGSLDINVPLPSLSFSGVVSDVGEMTGTMAINVPLPTFNFSGTVSSVDYTYGIPDDGNTYTYGPSE